VSSRSVTEELGHPAVRDLAGVMEAPCLLAPLRPEILTDDECWAELRSRKEALLALDRDPTPLLKWLDAARGSPLLGRYFEALLGFWIQHLMGSPRMEASLKVHRERQTIGELDFVFESPQWKRLFHWETSVKFYLCTAATPDEGGNPESYIGTMTKDRLDRKIFKLFGRQLEMPRSPEGREELRLAGFDSPPESRLFMKGALFYPAERDWRRHPHPAEVSAGHLRGWWSKELPSGADHDSRWVVLDRRRWLSPYRARVGEESVEPLTREQMILRASGHFESLRTAFMVAEVRRQGDFWREHERGLVVHPGWPWRVIE
jgi:hypothetical protein